MVIIKIFLFFRVFCIMIFCYLVKFGIRNIFECRDMSFVLKFFDVDENLGFVGFVKLWVFFKIYFEILLCLIVCGF